MASGLGRWLKTLVSRGSGTDQERYLAIDDLENGYYNYRLMRFRSDGDLVRYPDYIWSSAGYWAARGGLSVHLEELAEALEGAIYSDILVVLNREDRKRCLERLVMSWDDQLEALVDKQVERMIAERGWRLATPGRPVRMRVVGDGDVAMGGEPVGLEEGEFATALLPSLYHGPVESSRPLAEVFVRVPKEVGGKGGFRSVGTFYDDQLAFTIGRHWLDNGRDLLLPASALYTLHRFPGQAEINHRLNADLADRYSMVRTSSGQGDTITIQEIASSRPVLEVMLIPDGVERARSLPRDPRPAAGDPLGTLIPDGEPAFGGLTMIPEPEPVPSLVLSRRAVLLQRVHFSGVMRGYHMDVTADGTIVPQHPAPAARFRVEDGEVHFEPLRRDITLDGVPTRAGRRQLLDKLVHTVCFGNVTLEYRAAPRRDDPRWPYLAEITVPAEPTELAVGGTYRVGRDRRKCEIPLPDRAVIENILWHPSVNRQGAIRTRTGEVPVESFTTDSIMVAGRHAELDLRGSEPKVRALSKVCPVFVRRADKSVLRLIAREGSTAQPLAAGDELLIGNALFRVILPGGAQGLLHTTTKLRPPADLTPPPEGARHDDPSFLDPPEPEIADPDSLHDLTDLPSLPGDESAHERQVVAAVQAGDEPASPRDPERDPPGWYGDLPKMLRSRLALPELGVDTISLDESLTVAEG